jgi:hypothetical protein
MSMACACNDMLARELKGASNLWGIGIGAKMMLK